MGGKVMSVSQDSITRNKPSDANSREASDPGNDSSEPKGQELVYAARISLDKTQMQIDDKLLNLTPGMAITAEIKTGSRRVIEYLLSPLGKYRHDSFTER